MPFKSEKQKKWMYANKPKMAKKWSKKEHNLKRELRVKSLIKKMVREHGLNETTPNEYRLQAAELEMLKKLADNEMKALSIKTGGGIPGQQSLDDKEALVKAFSDNPEASLVDLHTKVSTGDDISSDNTDINKISSLLPALGLGGLGVAGLAAAKNKKNKENKMKNKKMSEDSKLINLPKTNKFTKSIPDTYKAPADRASIKTGGRGYTLTGNPDDFVTPSKFGEIPRPYNTSDYGSGESGYTDYSGETSADLEGDVGKIQTHTPKWRQKQVGITQEPPVRKRTTIGSGDGALVKTDLKGTKLDKFIAPKVKKVKDFVADKKSDLKKLKSRDIGSGKNLKRFSKFLGLSDSITPTQYKLIVDNINTQNRLQGENVMNKNLFEEPEHIPNTKPDKEKKLADIENALQWVDDHKKELGVAGVLGGGYLLNRHLKKKRKKKRNENKMLKKQKQVNEKITEISKTNWNDPVVTKWDDSGKQTDQYSIDARPVSTDRTGTDVSKYTKGKKGFLGIGKKEPKLIGNPKYSFDSYVKAEPNTPGLNNPDGPRYYKGTGTGRDRYDSFGGTKAELDAYGKIASNPADSLTYDQYSKLPFFKENLNINRNVRNLISEQIAVNENTRAMLAEKGLLKKLAKGALMLGLGAALHKGYQDKKLGFLQKPVEKGVDYFKNLGKKKKPKEEPKTPQPGEVEVEDNL